MASEHWTRYVRFIITVKKVAIATFFNVSAIDIAKLLRVFGAFVFHILFKPLILLPKGM